MREVSQEQFNRSAELYRQIDDLRTRLCGRPSLLLAEKIEIKRQMAALDAERRRVLGVES